jgi:hypothetical protein
LLSDDKTYPQEVIEAGYLCHDCLLEDHTQEYMSYLDESQPQLWMNVVCDTMCIIPETFYDTSKATKERIAMFAAVLVRYGLQYNPATQSVCKDGKKVKLDLPSLPEADEKSLKAYLTMWRSSTIEFPFLVELNRERGFIVRLDTSEPINHKVAMTYGGNLYPQDLPKHAEEDLLNFNN